MANDKPYIEVATWLGEEIDGFVARHDAAARSDGSGRNPSFWYEVGKDDPNHAGIRLRYSAKDCEYTFPAGRFLQIGQDKRRVSMIVAMLPLVTLTFEEARELAAEMRGKLEAAGWDEIRWYEDVSRETIASNPGDKSAWAGRWRPCGQVGQEAGLSIKDAAAQFVGTSVPLNALERAEPVKPGGEYLLVLEIFTSSE